MSRLSPSPAEHLRATLESRAAQLRRAGSHHDADLMMEAREAIWTNHVTVDMTPLAKFLYDMRDRIARTDTADALVEASNAIDVFQAILNDKGELACPGGAVTTTDVYKLMNTTFQDKGETVYKLGLAESIKLAEVRLREMRDRAANPMDGMIPRTKLIGSLVTAVMDDDGRTMASLPVDEALKTAAIAAKTTRESLAKWQAIVAKESYIVKKEFFADIGDRLADRADDMRRLGFYRTTKIMVDAVEEMKKLSAEVTQWRGYQEKETELLEVVDFSEYMENIDKILGDKASDLRMIGWKATATLIGHGIRALREARSERDRVKAQLLDERCKTKAAIPIVSRPELARARELMRHLATDADRCQEENLIQTAKNIRELIEILDRAEVRSVEAMPFQPIAETNTSLEVKINCLRGAASGLRFGGLKGEADCITEAIKVIQSIYPPSPDPTNAERCEAIANSLPGKVAVMPEGEKLVPICHRESRLAIIAQIIANSPLIANADSAIKAAIELADKVIAAERDNLYTEPK